MSASFQRSRRSGGTRSATAFATSFSSRARRTKSTNSACDSPISAISDALKPGAR
ncbi:MAG: hypothetical protein M3N49_11185 [Candidatus Eremiobacteraeota bacterium]|nr:hypothetical protein [Candidatus Eremiobacteraeota bacterium]